MSRVWKVLRGCALALGCIALPAQALAAGLFLAPRGVRPLSRGGSFVAGADDVHSLNYNPAGLAVAGNTVQVDLALPMFDGTYTRGTSGAYDSTVTAKSLGMPSPTLGVVHDFGWVKGLSFGFAFTAEYPLLQNWSGGTDGPERYAATDYRGTTLSKLTLGAGYQLTPWLNVGATGQALVGSFAGTNVISTCDGGLCTANENPAYDAVVQMRAKNLFVPGAQVGLQLRPASWLGLGLAWETGYTIAQDVSLAVRLPSAAFYDGAQLSPSAPNGTLNMRLPQQFRVGIEARPSEVARIEAAFVYEPWRVHDKISVRTGSLEVTNLTGVGNMSLGDIAIERGMKDTWSLRLGGEYKPPVGIDRPLTLRAGGMYEPSAVPAHMLSPMVVDLRKVLAAFGAQYTLGRWHFEATYAHVFMFQETVTNSQARQINPVPQSTPSIIGNGIYRANADILGIGARVDI